MDLQKGGFGRMMLFIRQLVMFNQAIVLDMIVEPAQDQSFYDLPSERQGGHRAIIDLAS